MNKPNVYILEYYAKRGPYDDSIGAKRSMLIVANSTEDARQTFIKSNPRANLIGIDHDSRQVGLSMDFMSNLLQSKCPGYMKAIKRKDDLLEQQMATGKQYNSEIQKQNFDLLDGI